MTIEKIILDTVGNRSEKIDVERNRNNKIPESNQVNVINAFNKNKRLNIMVIGAAIGLIICMLMLIVHKEDLPGEVIGIISTISGIFGACLKDAYSFEFGSSRGSKEKDEKLSSAFLDKIKY